MVGCLLGCETSSWMDKTMRVSWCTEKPFNGSYIAPWSPAGRIC